MVGRLDEEELKKHKELYEVSRDTCVDSGVTPRRDGENLTGEIKCQK